ncbi:GNAT family N-acetyltransferase [Bacillus sp. SCS-151]|uniref:GNAT family N-acetyltransferase n=1 Tax=Nanhaiella sioensis TaxID=3115293 RepID=UPI00397C745D
MIYELNKIQFSNVNDLLTSELVNIEIKGVVQGYNPGCVFVDNILNPTTAMVWSKSIAGFYFIGNENNIRFNKSINEYIDSNIAPRTRELGLNHFEFSGTSPKWGIAFKSIFKKRNLVQSKQLTYKYKCKEDSVLENLKMQDKFEMVKINHQLFHRKINNIDFVKSIILDWWSSLEDFIHHGVGYCMMDGELIVSCCISSCVTHDSMGSHTLTVEEYRKNGLAKILINEFLEHCRDHKLEAYWDCMDENLGSRMLAESCGYKKEFEYNLYSFKI